MISLKKLLNFLVFFCVLFPVFYHYYLFLLYIYIYICITITKSLLCKLSRRARLRSNIFLIRYARVRILAERFYSIGISYEVGKKGPNPDPFTCLFRNTHYAIMLPVPLPLFSSDVLCTSCSLLHQRALQ